MRLRGVSSLSSLTDSNPLIVVDGNIRSVDLSDVDLASANNEKLIMRYADVLLSYAECLVETGTSASDAAVYVDKVRERAGLSKLKDSRWKDCLSSKEVFIKRLQMERALELCFEGWRWADLKRWGLLDSQAGIDELKARDKDFNNFVIGKHKRMPIPTSEVEISKIDDVPQLTQNPNY